jgi:hypothetical protein
MHEISTPVFPRPVEGDCAPYYFRYIDQVPESDIMNLLSMQKDEIQQWILQLTPDQLRFRYAPDKWSLAEMIGHVLDTERIFAYRMLCISRGEKQSLPGFEQDDYARESLYDQVPGEELANEWEAVRRSTLLLCRHINADMASRVGTASGMAVRASSYPYILAGHVIHHRQIASERYLNLS